MCSGSDPVFILLPPVSVSLGEPLKRFLVK